MLRCQELEWFSWANQQLPSRSMVRTGSSPEKNGLRNDISVCYGTWVNMAHFIEDLLLMKNDQTNLKVKPNDFAAMSNYQGVILSKCFAMGFKFACVCVCALFLQNICNRQAFNIALPILEFERVS